MLPEISEWLQPKGRNTLNSQSETCTYSNNRSFLLSQKIHNWLYWFFSEKTLLITARVFWWTNVVSQLRRSGDWSFWCLFKLLPDKRTKLSLLTYNHWQSKQKLFILPVSELELGPAFTLHQWIFCRLPFGRLKESRFKFLSVLFNKVCDVRKL